MFSGIVECQSPVLNLAPRQGVLDLQVRRPADFNDLKIGDSISVNGVCLTLEDHDLDQLSFALAAETLHVTQWETRKLLHQMVNLERSLEYGARVHGHFVTGHVDGVGEVVEIDRIGEMAFLRFRYPQQIGPFFWKKGSVAVNGVSLTINEKSDQEILSVCLIPETMKRTNLGELQAGDKLNLEVDSFSRALVESAREILRENPLVGGARR